MFFNELRSKCAYDCFSIVNFANLTLSLKMFSLCVISGIETRVLDVMKKEDVESFAKSVGKIDVLFNCAG